MLRDLLEIVRYHGSDPPQVFCGFIGDLTWWGDRHRPSGRPKRYRRRDLAERDAQALRRRGQQPGVLLAIERVV